MLTTIAAQRKRKHAGRPAKAVRTVEPSEEVNATVAAGVIAITVVVVKTIDYLVCRD